MNRRSTEPDLISATRIILSEIAEILETYPLAVIAGGTVPYLLIPQHYEPHEGTVDIDIVLDLKQPGADEVFTLHEVLERRLFVQDSTKPYRYTKVVKVGDRSIVALIELLAGGSPPSTGLRHIRTEDVYVSIIQGMEVALESHLRVPLPEAPDQTISVASLPAFFAMKAVAVDRREISQKSKDAYDLVYCLRNYPGGIKEVAQLFLATSQNPLVASALILLKELFRSTDSVGPVAYASGSEDKDDSALLRREAFERFVELFSQIDSLSKEG